MNALLLIPFGDISYEVELRGMHIFNVRCFPKGGGGSYTSTNFDDLSSDVQDALLDGIVERIEQRKKNDST